MSIRFRKATLLDSALLLAWRNDLATRQSSIQPNEVSETDHEEWLAASLKNADRQLFVAELDELPIGTVRLDRREAVWELSWTVAPEARGKGIGSKMVRAATSLLAEDLVARVKMGNLASIRIVEAVGFKLQNQDGDLVTFFLKKKNS